MASCPRCSQAFVNALQLGAHMRACNVVSQPVMSATATATTVPVISQTALRQPVTPTPLHVLAQRAPNSCDNMEFVLWGHALQVQLTDELNGAGLGARDYRELQDMWSEYVKDAHACCTSEFWDVFSAVRLSTTTTRDKVLSVVKHILGNTAGHRWPGSSRVLRDRVRYMPAFYF